MAASLLHAARPPELVSADMQAYEDTALRLARDPESLAELRRRVAHARETSALYDTPRFTRNLEALFTRMLEQWRSGAAPTPLHPD